MVSVPCRASPPFTATVKTTEPSPVVLPPDVIVIHGTLLAAVHRQLATDASTATDTPTSPAAVEVSLTAARVNWHPGTRRRIWASIDIDVTATASARKIRS